MSSLTELNNYSNNTVEFTDNRPPGVLLTWPNARDISAITRTGTTFEIQRNIDIDDIVDPDGTLNLSFNIDLSSLTGAYITWPTLPGGVTTSQIGQVYSVEPVNSIEVWEAVRSPNITIPDDFNGTFEYTCTLNYQTPNGIESVSWVVGSFVPVSNPTATADLEIISNILKAPGFVRLNSNTQITTVPASIVIDPLEAGQTSTFDYIPGSTNKLLTAAPQLLLRAIDPIVYTVIVTADAAQTVLEAFRLNTYPGVTFSYNNTTKTATLVGGASDINTAIENLEVDVIDNPVKYYWNFNITFSVSNNVNEYVDNYTLPALSTDVTYQSISVDDNYNLNTATTIQGGPTVDPTDLVSNGVWTTTIRPLDETQVASLSGGEISGYGPVTLQRITAFNPGNETGRRVAASTDGSYLAIAGDNIHRIYYKDSTTWTTQATFDEDITELGNMLYYPDGPVFDMSDNAVILVYGVLGGSYSLPTKHEIVTHTRTGTSWLRTNTFELPNPSYNTRPVQIKLNKTGSKLAIATADGRILIYTISGNTWSLNNTINNVLTKTISGIDANDGGPYDGQPYTRTANYTFSAFDMDPSGNYIAVAMDIDFNNTVVEEGPGSNEANLEGLYEDRVSIYYGTSLQHDFAMSDRVDVNEYPESGDDPTSVSFNDGATSLIVCNSDVVYLTRSGSTWSDSARIDVAGTGVNSSSTTATISHDGTIMAAAGLYSAGADQNEPFVELWGLINGTWQYQFTTSGTDQYNTNFYQIQSVLSGNGEFFGYGNLYYQSGTTVIGETYMFTLTDYGRFVTGTKELTIIAPKDQTNQLVNNFTLTPATGETDVIKLIYETSNPTGTVSSRLHNINN